MTASHRSLAVSFYFIPFYELAHTSHFIYVGGGGRRGSGLTWVTR